ncbi:Neprosin [Arabidopsis suecica]|uniref:Neprosin n=1 Tax=Arabidopsis suecica TaxID=45249 RepID=A0A8T1YKF0_ARASU|nr:Neprosin [Arabidopsis suecica]
MASFNHFVLLILLTITLILSAEATKERRAIPTKSEMKEMERQLKAINKPALKSFKTEHGDIFDCIEIHKQLAFDHPLLKNHSVQLKPTTVPKWITGNNGSGSFDLLQEGISCPDGTVIVKRTTMQDLMHAQRLKSMGFDGPRPFLKESNNTNLNGKFYFATADYGPDRFGGVKGNINVWKPKILQDQVSIAYIAVSGGTIEENLASISVGWVVNPSMYSGDHVRLYAYWTTHGNMTGCYATSCPGFVQVSKTIPVSAILQPSSIYNGPQYELHLSLFQDRVKGDWWFAFKDENVGYWPASLFKSWRESNSANHAFWGGQVYSPVTEKTPPMGSGHWPSEGFHKSAYVSGLQIMDSYGTVFNPETGTVKVHESRRNCYKARYVHEIAKPWLKSVFYGGPGGCIG